MAVNLSKGQKVNLSKESPGLKKVMVGLGWDEVQQKRGWFAQKQEDIDCDAFAILLGADGKLINHTTDVKKCTVFFNNLTWPDGSIRHMGDNLTGGGDGDDEQIFVDLTKMAPDVHTIVFAVNIYKGLEKKQHFGMIKNAFIRVVDNERNKELCRFNLSENYFGMTGLVAGYLNRSPSGGWEFESDGIAIKASSLASIIACFGVGKQYWPLLSQRANG